MKKKFLSIEHKSLSDFGVVNFKELWEKAKSEGFEGISVCVLSTFTKTADSDVFHAIFSSSNEDRHGDIVQQVFDLKGFMRNPVFLDSHNYDSIEHIIGKIVSIGVTEGKLQGDIEFALDNPKGVLARNLAEKGFLNTTSIGFIPKVFNDEGHILESELLEISAVSVPANKDATFEKKAEAPEKKEVAAEPVVEPKKVNAKAIAVKATADLAGERTQLLKSLAKNVRELVEDGKKERSRKIYQIVRELAEKN
ncbi:MAG: HK97 family phage prohead protease [Candidatus Paceibacterota bacterium]|jgi:HK97 family phage prohead protease